MALKNTETTSCPSSDSSKIYFSIPPLSPNPKSLFQYFSENDNIQDILPDIDLNKALNKPTLFKSVKTCLNPPDLPQQSIQVTQFYQHPVSSGDRSKFVTSNIPARFPFLGSDYDLVHVGPIRLALTFNNQRGIPITTRIALLDSRSKNYQHSCLEMIETTFNSGTVVLTLFPKCTLPLTYPDWYTTFVVQIQIVGATAMDPGLVQTTLYSQTAYRFYCNDFGWGSSSRLRPIFDFDYRNAPIANRLPTSISREELVAMLPEAWLSDFEKLHTEE